MALVSTVIALERVGGTMVAHVDGVHCLVLEGDPAKLAHQLLCHRGWRGDGHERRHGGIECALLLRVGVLLLYNLESLPLPTILGG